MPHIKREGEKQEERRRVSRLAAPCAERRCRETRRKEKGHFLTY
jgi:hypothetical protein